MISTQVGFIAQLKGTLTKKRYTAATIFVDHYSRLKYVHLMTRLPSEETIEAKQAFEHFAEQHGIRILHYHCNNGRFADTPSRTAAVQRGDVLPSVESMHISKKASQKRPSGTSKRVHRSSSSMQANAGLSPSTCPSGHTHLGVPLIYTILYLF
jgi:hypothetical protein